MANRHCYTMIVVQLIMAAIINNTIVKADEDAKEPIVFKNVDDYTMNNADDAAMEDAAIEVAAIEVAAMKDVAIKVFQGTQSDLIWKDTNSGGRHDVSIYAPKPFDDYYSIGHIAVGSYRKPSTSFLIQAVKENAVSHPYDYVKRWDDDGSGAKWDVTIWEPRCHSGFTPLGHVAVRNHHTKPDLEDVVCVNNMYITNGKWRWIWNDKSTGSDDDATVWQAEARDTKGQGLLGMSAVRCHCNMDRDAFVLKSSAIQYIVGKPVLRYKLTDVEYYLDDQEIISNTSEVVGSKSIINNGTTEQQHQLRIVASYEESYDWARTQEMEVGVTIDVAAMMPTVGTTNTTLGRTMTRTYIVGDSVTQTKQRNLEVPITVQPKSRKTVTLTARRYVADIPFNGTMAVTYADGSDGTEYSYIGIYRVTNHVDINTVIGPDVPLN